MTDNHEPLPAIHTVVFDFDGVFTDNKVWVDQDGRESVRCDRGDGLALDLARAYQRSGKINAQFLILSKEANPVVLRRAEKLQLPCYHGVRDKLQFLTDWVRERFSDSPAPLAGVAYLGNDLNDLPTMRRVGLSVAPSDAHPRVQNVADLVLSQRGGDGFVRAFIERLLGFQDLSEEEIDELVSNC